MEFTGPQINIKFGRISNKANIWIVVTHMPCGIDINLMQPVIAIYNLLNFVCYKTPLH